MLTAASASSLAASTSVISATASPQTKASSPAASRKSSQKEKKRRAQKENERVEKLRLLVSYLKCGSSNFHLPQQVALEPDELELAHNYKLRSNHYSYHQLQSECSPTLDSKYHPIHKYLDQQVGAAAAVVASNAAAAAAAAASGTASLGVHASCAIRANQSEETANGAGCALLTSASANCCRSLDNCDQLRPHAAASCCPLASAITLPALPAVPATPATIPNSTGSLVPLSSPVSFCAGSSSAAISSTNEAETSCASSSGVGHEPLAGLLDHEPSSEPSSSARNTRSVPHIGAIGWALRHSISDPGGSSIALSHHSPSHHNNHHHHHHSHHHNHTHRRPCGQLASGSSLYGGPTSEPGERRFIAPQAACSQSIGRTCNNTSSSINNNHNNNNCITLNDSHFSHDAIGVSPADSHSQLSASLPLQGPRLFYIDDFDVLDHQHCHSTTINTNCNHSCQLSDTNNNNLQINKNNTSSTTKTSSEISIAAETKISAWSTPQSLAAWVDNEVNSLVHDLEVQSHLVESNKEKSRKSKRRKWLSPGTSSDKL